jgi:hypothetical protein
MASPTDLPDLAEEFLDVCVEVLDTIPTYNATLDGAPERAFVTFQRPIFDCCPQLTVHVGSLTEGASAPQPPKTSVARINRATLIATIIRCVPTDAPAIPAVSAAAAVQVYADRWALWNGIWNRIAEGLLFDKCGNVIWVSMTPIPGESSGECAGSVLTLSVSLDGYTEAVGT